MCKAVYPTELQDVVKFIQPEFYTQHAYEISTIPHKNLKSHESNSIIFLYLLLFLKLQPSKIKNRVATFKTE